MAFSTNLKALRKEKEMSQEDLADKLGYKSSATIQKWESGLSEPAISVICRISEIFDVSIDSLVNDDFSRGEAPKSPSSTNKVIPAITDLALEVDEDIQMMMFDLLCAFAACSPIDQYRIRTYANLVVSGKADTREVERVIDKLIAGFKEKYNGSDKKVFL